MNNEKIIKVAEFEDNVCKYWLLAGTIYFVFSVVGIPLLILWIPLALFFTRRYLSRMECTLTSKSLKVGKGIMVRTEKTIPLEKITDMGMVQGPIMRKMGLHTLTVETAGQSGTGALVSLTGIKDAPAFRQMVLDQRDQSISTVEVTQESKPIDGDAIALLKDIRDTLVRMEERQNKVDG